MTPRLAGPSGGCGVGTACYWQALALSDAGMDVSVLFTGVPFAGAPAYWTRHFNETAPFTYVDLRTEDVRHAFSSGEVVSDDLLSDRVLAWLRGRSFDVILFQEFLGHGARALQARAAGDALAGVRVITTVHSPRRWLSDAGRDAPLGTDDVVVDFMERESARLADRVQTSSAYMAEWIRRHWKLESDVIPHCYDAEIERPPEPVQHVGPFRHLAYVGNLDPRKGLDLFTRAVATLPPGEVDTITVIGPRGGADAAVVDRIQRAVGRTVGAGLELLTHLETTEIYDWLETQRGLLVVVPRIFENVPYILTSLWARQIPFISTDIGGASDVVGTSNRHLLAACSVEAIRARVRQVLSDGLLRVDYGDGYDTGAAARTLSTAVRAVHDAARPKRLAAAASTPTVVVLGDGADASVATVRAAFAAVDARAATAEWLTVREWADRSDEANVVFVDPAVIPTYQLWDGLTRGLGTVAAGVVTSYFARGEHVIRPLGRSAEAGVKSNVFGGPCFAAAASVVPALRQQALAGATTAWPLYASAVAAGAQFAIIPDVLYAVDAAWSEASTPSVCDTVARALSAADAALDASWLIQTARLAPLTLASAGSTIEEAVASAAPPAVVHGPFDSAVRELRARLTPLIDEWQVDRPQLFVAGAGLTSRLLLAALPALEPLVAGYVDDRVDGPFRDKPVVRPAALRPDLVDVLVIPSPEFEAGEYAVLGTLGSENVKLFGVPQPRNRTSRVSRRFGRGAVDLGPLRAMYAPPAWVSGNISAGDAAFLYECILAFAPTSVLELGVASGASSSAILCALDQLPAVPGRRLDSVDLRGSCYFNPSHAVGEAVAEMYPHAQTRWRLETGVSAAGYAAMSRPASVDLLFLDANHYHPWPVLDVLHLADTLRPNAWIVLHDVELPLLDDRYQMWGPHHLYAAWPFNKVHASGEVVNIAAIQMPGNPAALIPLALELVQRRWDRTPGAAEVELPPLFAEVERVLRTRLQHSHADAVA